MKLRLTFVLFSLACCLLNVACGGGSSTPPPPPPPPQLVITTDTLPSTVVGHAYSVTLQATGGTGALTWSLVNPLPDGLSLSSSGVLSGTPTSSGNFAIFLQARDSGNPAQTATTIPTLFVAGILSLNSLSIPAANRGVQYFDGIAAFGGTPPLTYSISAGALPPGLSLTANGSQFAQISGTPTQKGTFNFTIQVTDSGTGSLQQTTSAPQNMDVQALLVFNKPSLANGLVGRAYSDTVTTLNGVAPLHFVAQNLPPGLSIDSVSGTVSGTPSQPVFSGFVVTVTDSSVPQQSNSTFISLTIFDVLHFNSTTLPNLVINVPGSDFITAQGGVPPLSLQMTSGNLPPGMTFTPSGSSAFINGTPTQLGSYSFVVHSQDSAVPPEQLDTTLTVNVVPAPPQIKTTTLPRAIVGRAYSASLGAVQGTPPYNWSISTGSLPAGLMLDSQGLIHGTPTGAGISQFAVHLADSGTPVQTADANLSINVLAHALGRNDSIATATPISSGFFNASISPFSDPSSAAPDTDYYRLTANPGATVSVSVRARLLFVNSTLDPVIEIVDSTGTRFTTCNDPVQAFLKPPAVPDPNPSDFDDPCINDDDPNTGTTDSSLRFQVPGTTGPPVTFYIHVFDFRGDARPDMLYQLIVSGAN